MMGVQAYTYLLYMEEVRLPLPFVDGENLKYGVAGVSGSYFLTLPEPRQQTPLNSEEITEDGEAQLLTRHRA